METLNPARIGQVGTNGRRQPGQPTAERPKPRPDTRTEPPAPQPGPG
jgi:hypothetical protein